MAYDAKILNVMIASPSDVKEERQVAKETIYDWNATHSFAQEMAFLPLMWENSVAPELRGRAQGVINDRILSKADLVVGIFWTRLGTPTGEHESGTVEEIKEHHKLGRPISIYFSKRPIMLESVDQQQYQELLKFKTWCQEQGIYSEFEAASEFKYSFQQHLSQLLSENEYLQKFVSNRKELEQKLDQPEMKRISFDPLAIRILYLASKDDHGVISQYKYIGGISFSSGRTDIAHNGTRKAVAKIEAAIEELEENGLVRDTGFEREIFEITHEGYKAIEQIAPETIEKLMAASKPVE